MDLSAFLEGLPTALLALRKLADRRQPGDASGPHPLAFSSYLKFERAAMELLSVYRMLPAVGIPPKLLGGIYTWPAVMRLHKRLLEASTDLTVAFGEMAMLGTFESVNAAFEFVEATATVPPTLKPSGGRLIRFGPLSYTFNERITMTPDVSAAIDRATLALRDFIVTVRAELELPLLPTSPRTDGEPSELAE